MESHIATIIDIIQDWNHAEKDAEIEKLKSLKDSDELIPYLVKLILDHRPAYPEDCILLSDQLIEIATEVKHHQGIGEGYNHKGACFWIIGEYEYGLDELNKAYRIANHYKYRTLKAKVYNNFGRIYRELGDISSALSNFEHSMQINEDTGNELNLTINLTNISNLYYDLGDYDTALDYALRCVPIFINQQSNNRLVSTYHHLGNIYFKQEELKEASRYFELVLELGGDQILYKAMAYGGLGKVFFLQGNVQAAKEYLNMALQEAEAAGSFETKIIAHFYLSKLYFKTEEYDAALRHALRGYELSIEYSRRQDEMSIHEMLANIYDKQGDIANAYKHLKQYETLKESIFQQTTLNNLRNLQIKNQILFAKKEKEVAEKTAQLKQQFMANMSHEIRTPLNAISGITNILLENNPSQEQLKYLNAIKISSDNLLNIINDILDIAKIESGKIVLETIDFNIYEVIDNIIQSLHLKALEKNIYLKHDTQQGLPQYLKGDPTRIAQILINLIGNAIKFTERGGVTLRTDFSKNDNGQEIVVTFFIIDTGIGIEKDYVDKIFESFTQAGTDTARKFGGTGLGLTISKELTEMMNGSITVESEIGSGTTFIVQIPMQIGDKDANKGSEYDFTPLDNIRILLAEDNEFNVMVAQDTLSTLGKNVSVTVAHNGQEACQLLESEPNKYDIILMDIQMPVMDGIATTEWIRKHNNPAIHQKKIIALTANVFADDIKHYYDIGINAYVTKPFKKEELHKAIYEVLNAQDKSSNTVPTSVSTQEIEDIDLDSKMITNLDFLKSFTNNNEEKMLKYIRMFRTNAPRLLHNIQEGFEKGNYEQIKIAAHSLKPQLGYMGVEEQISNIYLLEKSADEKVHKSVLAQLTKRIKVIVEKALKELPE